MSIIESLRKVEDQIFKNTGEVHDLVGAYLTKEVDKNKLQETLNNKDVKNIIKLLEGITMQPGELNNLLDRGGTEALEKELLSMPIGSTASFIGQDFFGYFKTTGTKTGEDNWHLISYGLSGEREGEYFDEVSYSSSHNFAYWAIRLTTGYDYVSE